MIKLRFDDAAQGVTEVLDMGCWRKIVAAGTVVSALLPLSISFAQVPYGTTISPVTVSNPLNRQALPPLPDGVEKAYRLMEREVNRSRDVGAPTPELVKAANELIDAIPCSPHTRSLMLQARRLAAHAPTTNTWDAVSPELDAITGEVAQDPSFRTTIEALGRRFDTSLTSPAVLPILGQFPFFAPIGNAVGYAVPSPEGYSATSSSAVPNSYPWKALRPGDILLICDRDGHKGGIEHYQYARTFSHAGIYLGNGVTYEAMNSSLGVRTGTLDYWRQSGKEVAIGRVGNRSDSQNSATASWVRNKFGDNAQTSYHLLPPWDKGYISGGLYCSQLVWEAFQATSNIDLDSNNASYMVWFVAVHWYLPPALTTYVCWAAVFPDEIRASDKVFWWYDGTNP